MRRERRFWTHWQNLNESGRDILHGRAWLHIPRRTSARTHSHDRVVQFCWRFGPWNSIRAEFSRGGEDDYGLSFGLGFLNLYLVLSGWRAYDALPRDWHRETGISLYEDHLSLRWDCDDSSTYHRNGKSYPEHGWYRSWFLMDVLFGSSIYSSAPDGPTVPTHIVMPEAIYSCMVQMHLDTWKRPRWPFPRQIMRATIDVPGGVPHPGKGENSYDCGEDATYSQTSPATSVIDACQRLEKYVLGRRLKYGGRDWQPAALRPTAPTDGGTGS